MGIFSRHGQKVGNDIYGVRGRRFEPGDTLNDRQSDAPETGFRHNDHYHRYFRGYTEVRNVKPNGKISIERIYTSPWQVLDVPDQMYVPVKLFYLLLSIIIAAVYIIALSQTSALSNSSFYVAVPGIFAMAGIFLNFAVSIIYLATKRRMTYYDKRLSSGRLKVCSLICGITLALTFIAKVVFMILNKAFTLPEILTALAVIVCGAVAFAENRIESKMPYREEDNTTPVPEGDTYEIW